MKQLILILFIFTLSMANSPSIICDNDIKNIVSFYSLGDKYHYDKDIDKAIKSYKKTISYTKKALETCQNKPYYNENTLYDYMISSEMKIFYIKQSQVNFH